MNMLIDPSDAYFDEIYEKYCRLVMQISINVLRDEELAKDAFQLTFFSFARNVDKIKHTPEKAKRYLLKTAYSSAIDLYRKNKRIRNYEIPLADKEADDLALEQNGVNPNEICVESFEKKLFEKYDRIRLYDSLAKLRKREQEYIKAYYYDELTIHQIAQKHGISEAAAKKRVYRSVKKLRDIFFRKGV